MIYRVGINGWIEVEANSEEEALSKAEDIVDDVCCSDGRVHESTLTLVED